MKPITLVCCLLIVSVTAFADRRGAISFSGGPTTEGDLLLSASYFHPVLVDQLYLSAGFAYFDVTYQPTRTTTELGGYSTLHRFTGITQLNLGVRFGDYLFAAPRLSYNLYSDNSSVGWGIAVGFLLRPWRTFSLGFSAGHDQIRIESTSQPPRAPDITSATVVFQFTLSE